MLGGICEAPGRRQGCACQCSVTGGNSIVDLREREVPAGFDERFEGGRHWSALGERDGESLAPQVGPRTESEPGHAMCRLPVEGSGARQGRARVARLLAPLKRTCNDRVVSIGIVYARYLSRIRRKHPVQQVRIFSEYF